MIGAAGQFVWEQVFEFQDSYGRCESAVWRAVMPDDSDVHAIGCEKQATERARGRSTATYLGFIDSTAGQLRATSTTNGHRFEVIHVPSEGDWHLHIHVLLANGFTKLNKTDKADVRTLIAQAFGPLIPHSCT